MLKAFLNAFRVPDLRNKILFTLLVVAIYRFGAHVPVPVVDFSVINDAVNDQGAGGFLQFINLFSGGALGRMAVFGLGIMPYITSSIIMQLLTVVIPSLQALQEQGEVGVKKINQYTRYVTVVLALLQSTGIVFLFHSGQQGIPDIFPPETVHRTQRGVDRAHADRRHRHDHVAGRAHHPARGGQRHVHPDLHVA